MKDNKSQEVQVKANSAFPVLSDPTLALSMAEGMTNSDMRASDLPRMKVPSGGGTMWSIQTADGERGVGVLDAIILLVKGGEKAWWIEQDPQGTRPACVSHDGVTGVGNNTVDPKQQPGAHECASCHWGSFGSDRKTFVGKDCKDMAIMFFLIEGGALPRILYVPPTSLRALTKFRMALLDAQITKPYGVRTKITLDPKKSASGVGYVAMNFTVSGRLTVEETALLEPMALACASLVPQALEELPAF